MIGPGTVTTKTRARRSRSGGQRGEGGALDGSVATIIALFVGGFLLMLWASR